MLVRVQQRRKGDGKDLSEAREKLLDKRVGCTDRKRGVRLV